MKVGKLAINLLMIRLVGGQKRLRRTIKDINRYPCFLDVPYMDDDLINHKFDVFKAVNNRNNICVIDIHGGAYMFSQHRDNYYLGMKFVEDGFDFASLDYLPNDGKRHTLDLINDVYKNLMYLFDHLKDFGLENDTFILTGDSAGGHFALLFAELISDKQFANKLGFDFKDIKISSVMINCPVYDFINIGKDYLSKSGFKRMFGPNYNDLELKKLISPKEHIDSLKVPIFVSTCKQDFLRNESLTLVNDLSNRNMIYEFVDIDSDKKNIQHVHNLVYYSEEESVQVNNSMVEFALRYS